MNEKYIRKQSWSSIFGGLRDAFSDEAFNTAGADINGSMKQQRHPLPAPQRGGSDPKKTMPSDPFVYKGAEPLPSNRQSMNSDTKRMADSYRGYPAPPVDPRFSGRSSSTVSTRRYQTMPRPALDAAATNSTQMNMSEASFGRSTQRSLSSRPSPAREQPGLPSLDSLQAPRRDSSRDVQAGRPPIAADAASGKCDKCDSRKHGTDTCPHFKKPRDKHKDAWANYGTKGTQQLGAAAGNYVLRSGRCVRQPGDGNCLFHSLCFGLNDGKSGRPVSAGELRGQLANFIAQNPHLEISGDSLEEWVKWDTNSSAHSYASKMARGGWGGGLEMAACSLLMKVNVHVYERGSGGFKRISCFDHPGHVSKTVHVLYQGGVHYDALVPFE